MAAWDLSPCLRVENGGAIRGMPRHRVILGGLALLALVIAPVACGDSGNGEEVGTTSSETSLTSSSSATTGTTTPPTGATSETSATSEATPSSDTSTTSTAPRPTVNELEQALATEIAARFPEVGTGVVDCGASGELAEWQPILCSFLPTDPLEFGGVYVSMLDGGRYAWVLGPCCDAGPSLEDYPPGLFCRDLANPPPGIGPGRWPPEDDHLSYGLAMFYWLNENRPDRMDADLDGRPCETIYPSDEVTSFWDSARTL